MSQKKNEPKAPTSADYFKLEKKLAKTEAELEKALDEITVLKAQLAPTPAPLPQLPADAPKITELPGGCIGHGAHPETAQRPQ